MGYREESEKRRQERHELQDSGKSIHHMVDQPGPGKGKRFRPHHMLYRAYPKSLDEAKQDLVDSAKRGVIACDWGCTTKVQSRGCALHAQVRWSR